MKDSFLLKIKTILETEKEELLNKQLETVDIDQSGDEVDKIQAKILANIQSQLFLRNQNKLKGIELAFDRIKEGSFGMCEDCGEEITAKRLLFNPLFKNCISCAEQIEFKEKNHRKM